MCSSIQPKMYTFAMDENRGYYYENSFHICERMFNGWFISLVKLKFIIVFF